MENLIDPILPPYIAGDTRMPTGLLLAFAENMHALEHYSRLPEEGRQRLLAKADKIHSKQELSALIRDMGEFM